MKKLGCVPTALIAVALLWILLEVYTSIRPVEEGVVHLPMGNAVARFQVWGGGWGELPFVLRVDTPHGTISRKLWTDWGPAHDLIIYRTSENWLVGIGGGGETTIIDAMSKSGPQFVSWEDEKTTDDKDWTYFGYLSSKGFTPASEREECIALLGAGENSYRKEHQFPHSC